MRPRRSTRWVACAAAAALLSAACGGASATPSESTTVDTLTVASFDFVESELLAELYAQGAELVHIPVTRLGAVGPREIARPAMQSGQFDLMPEYAGTALVFAGAEGNVSDIEVVVPRLNERLADGGLIALEPAPAVDTNVFVVTAETAEANQLSTISDLTGRGFDRFGGPAECMDRALCLLGLQERYGLTFAEFVAHPSLSFTAEALRRDEVDVGLMFSTSPELTDDLIALLDDRLLQPADNVIPVLRADALDRWGDRLERTLNEISARLTTSELRRLNEQVASGVPIADVAATWLRAA